MPDDWEGHPLRKDDAPARVPVQFKEAQRAPMTRDPVTSHRAISSSGPEAWPESDETMIVNLGPQHPSTHGVLRVVLELEGETVLRAKPVIGYLHTGMEKTGEQLTYVQGSTNVTRMDYAAPLFNELAFSMAVERLLDLEVPPRATWIRMLMCELNRVSSHLLFLATNGMDLGAISMMLYGWRERELVLAFFEKVTGLRMNHNYIRPGGVAADLPPGWQDDVEEICEVVPRGVAEYDELLTENPIWLERTVGIGVITTEQALALGRQRADPAVDRACRGTCARRSPTWPTTRSTSTSSTPRTATPSTATGSASTRSPSRSRSSGSAWSGCPSGDYRIQDRKVTPPPRARIDESMEALIHHFKIFTEGFKVPAGETYVAVENPRGELGCYLVSDGSGRPVPDAHPGRLLLQPADAVDDGPGRPRGRRHRHHLQHRPDHGRRRPVIERRIPERRRSSPAIRRSVRR